MKFIIQMSRIALSAHKGEKAKMDSFVRVLLENDSYEPNPQIHIGDSDVHDISLGTKPSFSKLSALKPS